MRHFRPPPTAQRTELVLTDGNGMPWRLLMAPGTERFIGRYPRVAGIAGDCALLAFRKVASAAS